jgi:hypothetical protein
MSMNNYPVKNIQVTTDMISYLLCGVVFICLRFLMSFILSIAVARTLVPLILISNTARFELMSSDFYTDISCLGGVFAKNTS